MVKIDKEKFITASVTIILLTIIVLLFSYFFATTKWIIGPILIVLGIISLIPLSIFKIPIRILKADILFGMIDNGLLAIFALIGAELFGILGAIVGSVVGNAITDGLAGIFEGYGWQRIVKLKIKDKRTALTVAIGKLAGCLLGAGVVLTIAWSILNLA
ncbi:hypothetical protein J4444_01555 [Candidatus Woesearchaeota archaeon]|nr:hypothetical protein [Candidatus Woesearchaeota archaeon]